MAENIPSPDWQQLHIHFVAIGGIGMSALARIAVHRGSTVSGCDGVDGPVLDGLRERAITCHVGHSPAHLDGVDIVVYSTAVPLDSPEMAAAAERGIRIVHRGSFLAWLQDGHETVAVSGAHGKTTTTWIVANALIRAGLDPTVAVGGLVADLDGNSRCGTGGIFVTEADESDRSFLRLSPKYPVITNIDADHLDHYAGIGEIRDAFAQFAEPGPGGAVIACIDGPHVEDILSGVRGRKITYGIGRGDIAAENVRLEPSRAVYDAVLPGCTLRDVVISMPGVHNVQNSLAALALAHELDLPMDAVCDALANTSHVGRRLEFRGCERGVSVYDDYAHHPAEIAATLEAARMLAPKRLVGIFQPHRYTRTLHLQREFGRAFDRLDLLLIAPIYAASEPPIEGVTSALIARRIEELGDVETELTADFDTAAGRLSADLEPGDTLITLGAGDVWQVGDAVLKDMKQADAA